MENTLSVTLMIVFLLIGAVGGVVLTPENTVTEYVEVPVVEFVNNTVTETVEVEVEGPSYLDLAVAEFLQAVEDEEDEAGRDVLLDELDKDYYFDEMTVKAVDDNYEVIVDDDKVKVFFEIDLKFDDGDERDKATYFVKVVTEDDEDTKVTVQDTAFA